MIEVFNILYSLLTYTKLINVLLIHRIIIIEKKIIYEKGFKGRLRV